MTELPTTHDDVEFHAEFANKDEPVAIFPTWERAVEHLQGFTGTIDVVIWSEEGADAYNGSNAVEQYRTDPEASVFERYVRLNPTDQGFDCLGMIP